MGRLNTFKQIINSIKLAADYLKDPQASMGKKVLLIFPLIYIITPFDLVSDFIPLLGWLDDTIIGLVVWKYVFSSLNSYQSKNDEHQEQEEEAEEDADYTLEDDEYDIE
ncbi:YkvA family protein [Halanaerobaculum tunisiense]